MKKKRIIKNVSVQINKGESIGIVGPNGAGKSTFLKILASVLKPDSGTVFYNGVPYSKNVQDLRKQIGYIPQEIALFEELTVKDQIHFWKKAAKNMGSPTYILEMLHALGLHHVYHQKVKALSGGWKRKLNVCAGMLHNPDIILLDEPTAGVDLAAKDDLLTWLKSLHKSGKTIILISHEWDVINYLSDSIFVLQNGEILFEGPSEQLDQFEKDQLDLEENQELIKILRQRKR